MDGVDATRPQFTAKPLRRVSTNTLTRIKSRRPGTRPNPGRHSQPLRRFADVEAVLAWSWRMPAIPPSPCARSMPPYARNPMLRAAALRRVNTGGDHEQAGGLSDGLGPSIGRRRRWRFRPSALRPEICHDSVARSLERRRGVLPICRALARPRAQRTIRLVALDIWRSLPAAKPDWP